MLKIGYARVSTDDQKLDLQIDALKGYGCDPIFKDEGITGSKMDRPGLMAALSACRDAISAGVSVQLVVWRLDRLGRDNVGLLMLLKELNIAGIGFYSITEGAKTDTPIGNFITAIQSAQAQFEKEQMLERSKAGREAAKARGIIGGRPKKLTNNQLIVLKKLIENKSMSMKEIAKSFGISRQSVYNYIKKS